MLTRTSLFISFVFILISTVSFSQGKSGLNGYFVGKSGDTTRGYIILDGKSKFSSFIIKPNSKSGESTLVSFDSCKVVSVNNEEYYSWTGTRSVTYVDRFSFEITNADSVVTETIPLKLLYKGFPFSLYVFKDKREHYFLEVNNSISELRLVFRHLSDWEKMQYGNVYQTPKYFTSEIYKSQLLVIMNNELTKRQIGTLKHTTYDKSSLIRLLKELSRPTASTKYKVSY